MTSKTYKNKKKTPFFLLPVDTIEMAIKSRPQSKRRGASAGGVKVSSEKRSASSTRQPSSTTSLRNKKPRQQQARSTTTTPKRPRRRLGYPNASSQGRKRHLPPQDSPQSVQEALSPEKSEMICNIHGTNCDPHFTVFLNKDLIRFYQQQAGHDGTQIMHVEKAEDAPRLAPMAQKRKRENPGPTAAELLSDKYASYVCKPDRGCDLHWEVNLNREEIQQAMDMMGHKGLQASVLVIDPAPESRGRPRPDCQNSVVLNGKRFCVVPSPYLAF